jgi:hypothetical protein
MQGNQKRQTRSARSPEKERAAAPAPRPSVGPRPATVAAIERIVGLQIQQAPLEIFAPEVLPALLDGFSAPAGALLLYRCEEEALALVAARGLSASGHRRLDLLRPGAVDTWEIPLHGLLNHKAYIIERPDGNPFVPDLVEREEIPRVATIASIPLYRGPLPVGVLLVISDRRPINEVEILSHVLAFDALAIALEPFGRAPGNRSAVTDPAADAPAPGEAAADASAAALVCEAWEEPRQGVQQLETELAAVVGERHALAERLAEVEPALADALGALEAERSEAARLAAAQDAIAAERRASERAQAEAVAAELRAEVARLETELGAAREAHAAALARMASAANEGEAFRAELAAVRAEVARLREDDERVQAAAGGPGADPAAVMQALREQVTALEGQVGAVAAERAELARSAVAEAEEAEHRLAVHRRALDERRARHERELGEAHAAAERRLENAHGSHQRELSNAGAAHRRELADVRAAHQDELAEVRARDAEALAKAVALAEARATEIERFTAQRDDLEARLQWTLGEREDAASAASAREHAALERLEEERRAARERLESARRTAAAERTALEEQLAAVARERAEHAARVGALERELAHREEMIAAAARRSELLDGELTNVRAEVTRLLEDREQVLAAVDDPEAEPAAVIRALRETVAALQGQADAFGVERAELTRRAAAEAEEAAHRLATHRRELEEVRAAHQHELADLHATTERLEAERYAGLARAEADRDGALAAVRELQSAVAERDAALAARDRALGEIGGERERLRQAALEAGDLVQQLHGEIAGLKAEHGTLSARLAAMEHERATYGERMTALASELACRDEAVAAAAQHAETLDGELAAVRAEAARLREDHERVLAALDYAGTEPAAVIGALRQQVAALEAQMEARAAEHAELMRGGVARTEETERRLTMHRRALDELRADHERELATTRASTGRQLEEARAAHARAIEEMQAARQRDLESNRAAIARLEEERRAALERMESERRAAETERAAQETHHEERLAAARREVEEAVARAREEAIAQAREDAIAREHAGAAPAGDAPARPPSFASSLTVEVVPPAEDAASAAPDPAAGAASTLASTPPAVSPSAPPSEMVEAAGHRILEPDAERRQRIAIALAEIPAPPAARLVVANVLAPSAAGLTDLGAAVGEGETVIGYAADEQGRSRVLGAIRCFATPPTSAEAVAALGLLAGTSRRLITLSDDVDAFMAAKAGLTKAGHSVSMACDAKQALDLLPMVTPDAVLVDVRSAPEAAAEFLAVLAPEAGRVLVLLVYGDRSGDALTRVLQRLLRPAALDPADLLRVCRSVLKGPQEPFPVRDASGRMMRMLERPKTATRKMVTRRAVPRRH